MEWEKFKEDPDFNDNLIYWYDEWIVICNNIEKGQIGIKIINIRIILSDIINEYELNQFKSEVNRKVYIKLIEKIIPNKYLSVYRENLLLLKESLEKKDKEYSYIIAKEIAKSINRENFTTILFNGLREILVSQTSSKKERLRIKELSQEIIIELITSGKNIKDIKNYISDAFSTYIFSDGKIYPIFKDIPSNIKEDGIKFYIDSLSIKDRLDSLQKSLVQSLEEYRIIFPIWGTIPFLKLELETEKVLGCELYSPDRRNEFDDSEFFNEAFNNCFENDDCKEDEKSKDIFKSRSRCNAIVTVKSFTTTTALQEAKLIFLNLISYLNIRFSNNYNEFFWDGQYLGKSLTTGNKFGTMSYERDTRKFRESISKDHPISLSNKKYDNLKEISLIMQNLKSRNMLYELSTIKRVITLLDKSRHLADEDKVLNYWIVMESLANISKNQENTYNFIRKSISNIYFLWEKYVPLHRLFNLTSIYVTHSYEKDESIYIPKEFIKDTGIYESFSEDVSISLKTFYKRMSELKNYTSKASFLDEIEDTLEFYKNNKKSLQRFLSKKEETRLTLDYIYKCRNQIVHNGYVDKNLIPYLVEYAEGYSYSLFNQIIESYTQDNFNLPEYFIKQFYQADLLEKKMKNKDFNFIDFEK